MKPGPCLTMLSILVNQVNNENVLVVQVKYDRGFKRIKILKNCIHKFHAEKVTFQTQRTNRYLRNKFYRSSPTPEKNNFP